MRRAVAHSDVFCRQCAVLWGQEIYGAYFTTTSAEDPSHNEVMYSCSNGYTWYDESMFKIITINWTRAVSLPMGCLSRIAGLWRRALNWTVCGALPQQAHRHAWRVSSRAGTMRYHGPAYPA